MRKFYIRILLVTGLITIIPTEFKAQVLCETCRNCIKPNEEVETTNEGNNIKDAKYKFDLDESPEAEMTLEEGDLLGTETEAITGVGVEVETEIAEVTAADLAVVAEAATGAIGAVVAVAMLGFEIYEWVHESIVQHSHYEEASAKLKRTAGEYIVPMLPTFPVNGEDLDVTKDNVSYVISLKKTINEKSVRDYLTSNHLDQHIGKEYPISQMKDNLLYAFSTFKQDYQKRDDSRYTGGMTMPSDTYFMDYVGGRKSYSTNIPIELVAGFYNPAEWSKSTYTREVANITLSKHGNNEAWTNVSMHYKHKNPVLTSEDWPTAYRNNYTNTRERTLEIQSKIVIDIARKQDKWYGFTDAKTGMPIPPDPANTILKTVVENIPYTVEDTGDKLLFRINNVNIKGLSLEKSDLVLRIRFKAYDTYTTLPNKYSYTRWTKSCDENLNLYSQIFPTTPIAQNDSFCTNMETIGIISAGSSGGIDVQGNKMLLPPPSATDKTLAFLTIRDYQPRDNEASIAKKTNQSSVNPFPILTTSGRTVYKSNSIGNPKYGTSNLNLSVPYNENWKKIEYIELKNASSNAVAVLKFGAEKNANNVITKYGLKSAYYNTPENVLTTYLLSPSTTTGVLPDISTITTSTPYITTISDTALTTKSYILQGVPFSADELVYVIAHYTDGSLSKKLVKINAINNFIPRAYYKFRNGFRNLILSHGNRVEDETRSHWLIELSENGFYTITNRKTGKVFGFTNGENGVYNWDPSNLGLYWNLKFTPNGSVKLFNIGQKAYLSLNEDGKLIYNFSDDLEFIFEKQADAEPLLNDTPQYVSNKSQGNILSSNDIGQAILDKKNSLSNITDNRHSNMIYSGCFTYTIQNDKTKKYLHLNSNKKLEWNAENGTTWLYRPKQDGYFTLSYDNYVLSSDNEITSGITISDTGVSGISENPPALSNDNYQFKLDNIIEYPDLVAHYAFDNNTKDSSEYANNGISHGELTYVNDAERGLVANFDGINDYVETKINYNPGADRDMSVELWIKSDNANYMDLIKSGKLGIDKDLNSNLSLYQINSLEVKESVSGVKIDDNNWHYIVGVFDAKPDNTKDVKLYIDGKLITSKNISSQFTSKPLDLLIGSSSYSRTIKGLVDNVKLWKKTLTPEEITQEFGKFKREELIAHYNFENNLQDLSKYQHHATSYGGLSFTNDSERGLATQFDGIDDYMDTNLIPSDFFKGNSMTFSSWVKVTNSSPNHYYFMMSDIFSSFIRDGIPEPWVGSSNWAGSSLNAKIVDGKWHYLTYVYEKRNIDMSIKMYMDGISIFERQIPSSYALDNSQSHSLLYGNRKNNSRNLLFYKGLLDEVKIWKKALSVAEITHEYNNSKINIVAGPIALYKFEDNANDSSGNNHHGTVNGPVSYTNDAIRGKVAKFEGGYVNTNFNFNPNNYNGHLTIGFWMKNKISSANNPTLIGGNNYYIEKNNNKLYHVIRGSDGNYLGFDNQNTFNENSWYYVIYVIDKESDGKIRRDLYVNGSLVGTSSSPSSQSMYTEGTLHTIIGSDINLRSFEMYDGYLDNVIIWDRSLNSNEVSYQYLREVSSTSPTSLSQRSSAKTTSTISIDNNNINIVVYPNPTDSVINITTDKVISKSIIFDFSGKSVQEFGNQKRLDISKIKEGIYILKVIFKDGTTENIKIIIAR